MQQFQQGTNKEFYRDPSAGVELTPKTAFDLEKVLPLEAVRVHTKTDDVPTVTDWQLKLYRKSAFEAAQEYTGLLLMGQQTITEDLKPPTCAFRDSAQTFKYSMLHAAAQNFVWYYGLKGQRPDRVPVRVGDRVVTLPRQFDDFGLGCCNPCGSNGHARIMYVAGFDCEDSIPGLLLLGCLKFIAHVVENPGDLVVATTVSGGRQNGVQVGEASNPAWASGAIEIWRTFKKDAI